MFSLLSTMSLFSDVTSAAGTGSAGSQENNNGISQALFHTYIGLVDLYFASHSYLVCTKMSKVSCIKAYQIVIIVKMEKTLGITKELKNQPFESVGNCFLRLIIYAKV